MVGEASKITINTKPIPAEDKEVLKKIITDAEKTGNLPKGACT